MAESRRVLVTGGAGYVGSHVLVQLLSQGYQVVVVDNLVNSSQGSSNSEVECLRRVEEITGKKVTFYAADICDKDALRKIFKNDVTDLQPILDMFVKPFTLAVDNVPPDLHFDLIDFQNDDHQKDVFYHAKILLEFYQKLSKDEFPKLHQEAAKHAFDCVIHFAALKAVGESVALPLTYYRNNVGGSVHLLNLMKEFNVKKIVYSSSATVYGTPKFLPLTEEHPTGQGCTNPYGRSKYFVEEIMKDLVISDNQWCVISLRYFNPVGAHKSGKIGEDPKGTPNNIMPYIAQVAVKRQPVLKIFGNDYDTPDGTGVRDYVHIEDLASGHLAAVEKILDPSFSGWKAYNLGTGVGLSVFQLVKGFEEASGCKVPYEVEGRRPGDIACCYADPSLAKKELNWEAKRGIKEMCEDMWRWQSRNPNGFAGDAAKCMC